MASFDDFDRLCLADPTISARGAKTCALVGDRPSFTIGTEASPVRAPFGASSFGNEVTARKNIDFSLPDQMVERFKIFDAWAVKYLTSNSVRLFGKQLTDAQTIAGYKSPVTQKASYQPTLRCKINTDGKAVVRMWAAGGKRMSEVPEDLRAVDLLPKIYVSHLWLMAGSFGWVLQVTDLMVLERKCECPFVLGEESASPF